MPRGRPQRSSTNPVENVATEEKENNDDEKDMVSIFKASQEHSMTHERLCQALKRHYNVMKFSEFWEDFLELSKYTIGSLNRSPCFERTIEFIVKFVLFCCKVDVQGAEVGDNQQLALLIKLLKFCVKHHDCAEPAVRFRCVQIMHKLLDGMGDEATISEELFQTIQHRLLKRVWDIKVLIRTEATHGLARLQDPTDRNCPIVTTFLHIVKHDTNPDVRRAAMKSMAVTTKTLPAIVERCRDVNDLVRKHAFEILSSRSILKPLTIAKRIRLLQDGLNDVSPNVREVCTKLLKRWLEMLEGNLLDLLKRLDVEESPDITEKALRTLLQEMTLEELVTQTKDKLDDSRVLKEEFWTPEGAFYWRVVCNYLREKEDEARAELEQVLPMGKDYSLLLRGLLDRQNSLSSGDPESLLELECTITNVCQLASCIDLSDEFGRQTLITFVKNTLTSKTISTDTIGPLIKLYHRLEPNETRMCDSIVELISEIRDPVDDVAHDDPESSASAVVMDACSTSVPSVEAAPEEGGSAPLIQEPIEMDRKLKIMMASLSVRLNELNEEMQEAVSRRDFERAGQFRDQIMSLEAERTQLLNKNKAARPIEPPVEVAPVDKDSEDEEMPAQTQNQERNDPEILLKCNTMTVKAVEVCKRLWRLPPSLLSLIDSLILPSITCSSPGVRNQAVLALGMCCTMNKDLAIKFIPLFYEILEMDHESIQVSSLKCIVDWFLIFGLEIFQGAEMEKTNENTTKVAGNVEETADASDDDIFDENPVDTTFLNRTAANNKTRLEALDISQSDDETLNNSTVRPIDQSKLSTGLLTPLIKLLDSTCRELRTACAIGLSKLILQHKVASPKLTSRLLLLWYNPVTEEDSELLNSLSIFFPIYASTRSEDQSALGETVLPTLKTLFRAPASSPLSEVDHWNVASLLLKLTDSSQLFENRKKQLAASENLDNPVHDDLAFRLANEVMNAPNASGVKTYVKMLANLRISPTNTQVMKDLLVMLHPMVKKIKDRLIVKTINKIRDELKAGLAILGDCLTPGRIAPTPGIGSGGKAPVSVQSRLSVFTRTMLENFDQPELLDEGSNVGEETLACRLEETYLGHRFNKNAGDVTRVGLPLKTVTDDTIVASDDNALVASDDGTASPMDRTVRSSTASNVSTLKKNPRGRKKQSSTPPTKKSRGRGPSKSPSEESEIENDTTIKEVESEVQGELSPEESYQEIVVNLNITRMELSQMEPAEEEASTSESSQAASPPPKRASRDGASSQRSSKKKQASMARSNIRRTSKKSAVDEEEEGGDISDDERLSSQSVRRSSRTSSRSSLSKKMLSTRKRPSDVTSGTSAPNTRNVLSETRTRNLRRK